MRRYFPELLGNEKIKERLGSAIERGKLPHAILIGGPDGSGKSTLATELAAALNCEGRENPNLPLPCGVCSSCKRIMSGSYPDIKILKRAKDRATIGVDAVKDLRSDMFLSSTEAECKIYIIEDAHTMTPESQNALLKVLEEPPSGVYIILLAEECDKILTTIKSRTQFFAMSRFDDSEIEEYLTKKSESAAKLCIEDREAFLTAIIASDGRIGRALELVNRKMANENKELRREILDLIRAICHKSGYAQIYRATASLPRVRSELLLSLEQIITALRDLIALKNGAEAKLLFFISREEAVDTASDISVRRLLSAYDAVLRAHELCYRNANVGNLITNLTSELKYGFCR